MAGSQVCVIVQVEIKPEALEEFHQVITKDAEDSLKEPGCLRFDVLQDAEANNKFKFYEVYVDKDAVAFHKTTPHYNLWAKFKEEGKVLNYSSQVHKAYILANLSKI